MTMTPARNSLCFAGFALALLTSACSGSGGASGGASPEPAVPSFFPGTSNAVPAMPEGGGARAGTIYNIYIKAPGTGDKVAFTVFEPATLQGGKTYPLVLHSHGFGNSRQTSLNCPQCAIGVDVDLAQFVNNGYGVISIDERGHGESTGTIRVMDPDYEGQDLLAVLDWAEANLSWLAYGVSVDGTDPHNLVVGSVGGSYGGMYQYLIHNIDPKHRLDAIVPQFAPNNLNVSLFPGGVIKADWDVLLFGIGNTAGAASGSIAHFDPYVTNGLIKDFAANAEDAGLRDFLYYHSNQYFCGYQIASSNGGPNTAPGYPPTRRSKVNALLFQGVRDTLFNFSEGYANYQCLKGEGGDVRLLSYQTGHNALQVVPDIGVKLYFPPGDEFDASCGTINVNTATVAFFDQYLKGIAGAADRVVPTKPCLSIAKGDGVLVDQVMTMQTGSETQVTVPSTPVIAGVQLDVPSAVELGIVGAAPSTVVGGIPHLTVTVTPAVPGTPGEPIIFVGLGQTHNGVPGVYDLINNQVLPLRGTGSFDVDMVGVAARLAPGDHLALLIYGLQDQFVATGSVNVAAPTVMAVNVSGQIAVPVLAPGTYAPTP
jgi:ABC-2 type transport system ATP-binding protein